MSVKYTFLSILFLLTISAAQSTRNADTTTVSVFLAGDGGAMSASVITANPTLTAYSAQCVKDVDACYFTAMDITVLDGSSYQMTMTQNSRVTNYVNCTVAGSAICTASLTNISGGGGDTTTTTIPESRVTLSPLIVTAGLDKLNPASSTTTARSTQSSQGAGSSQTAKPNAAGRLTPVWTTFAVLAGIWFIGF
jgi:hypothetical protein